MSLEPVRPVILPVPVLPADRAKSPVSTPVTSLLNTTLKTIVVWEVIWDAGSCRVIAVIVGSGVMTMSCVALSDPVSPRAGRTGLIGIPVCASVRMLPSGTTSASVPVYDRSVVASPSCTTYSNDSAVLSVFMPVYVACLVVSDMSNSKYGWDVPSTLTALGNSTVMVMVSFNV